MDHLPMYRSRTTTHQLYRNVAIVARAWTPPRTSPTWLILSWLGLLAAASPALAQPVAVIEIVDAESRRGIPLVELETIAHNRFVSDSAGRVAITAPDLVGRDVFFTVTSHGYEMAKDGFGFAGRQVRLEPGSSTQIELKRINLAERWFRLTGSGIFVDSIVAGLSQSDRRLASTSNTDVVGCDSVMTAQYGSRLYWFWGDTLRPHYPIGGNFHMTGATTTAQFDRLSNDAVPQHHPPQFDYLVDQAGIVRAMAPISGEGPTWLSALSVLPAATADSSTGDKPTEVMVAGFIKVRNQLDAYRWGFAKWNDSSQQFEQLLSFDQRPRMFLPPQTHTFLHQVDGINYLYFANPLPLTRVKATLDAYLDPTQYEGYSCLQTNSDISEHQLDRDPAGKLRYAWKRNTPALTSSEHRNYIEAGYMRPDESIIKLRDVVTQQPVIAHSGSVHWNAYRQRWILITVQLGGSSSLLGEVWYAEADRPEGPWTWARKVVTHHQYSFYNPKHHPCFDSADGSLIFFEGTYTHTFSGNTHPTERYDYNQILYRLDLRRPELNLPVAIYRDPADPELHHTLGSGRSQPESVAFYALDRPTIGVQAIGYRDGRLQALTDAASDLPVAFYAPTQRPQHPEQTPLKPLYCYTNTITQEHLYATEPFLARPDVVRQPEPICWVWSVE